MLIELFSLGVTAEALRANIGSKWAVLLLWLPVDPKFQVEWVALDRPFFRSFVWYKNLDRFFFHFVTIHAFDRQTDRQTEGQHSLD